MGIATVTRTQLDCRRPKSSLSSQKHNVVGGPNYLNKDRDPDKPDYLGRDTGVDWRQHEKDTETRSGGRRQPGSGHKPGAPGDVRDIRWLRENKASRNGAEGMFIKGTWLQKIVAQALPRGLDPIIELRFDGQAAPVATDWVLLPAIEFEALLDRANEGVRNVGDDDRSV